MPSATTLLPVHPAAAYTKPTLANTHGGKTYTATHPDLFRVEFQVAAGGESDLAHASVETYSSRLVATRDFAPHETITMLDNLSQAAEKAYSSVQFGPGAHDHFELNSDLLFMNHSCAPTAELCLPPHQPGQWQVRASARGIQQGQDITFFYPSTEWDMAQSFDCSCGAIDCLGSIQGAKYLSISELEGRGYVNEHIRTLKSAQ